MTGPHSGGLGSVQSNAVRSSAAWRQSEGGSCLAHASALRLMSSLRLYTCLATSLGKVAQKKGGGRCAFRVAEIWAIMSYACVKFGPGLQNKLQKQGL